MSKFICKGSTDVAIMAIFDIDDSKNSVFDENYLSKLESSNGLIKLVGDSDGNYVLHLYVDSEISESLNECSISEREINGSFFTCGHIAYGGIEKVGDVSLSNAARHDVIEIPGGEYIYKVLHVEYPSNYLGARIEKAIGAGGVKYLDRPRGIIRLGVIIGLLLLISSIQYSSWFYLPLAILIGSTIILLKKYLSSHKYRELDKTVKEIEMSCPDFIVQLKSIGLSG